MRATQAKKKDGRGSIYRTRGFFSSVKGEDGVTRRFIGNKKHNIDYLSIKNHGPYGTPNSLYIQKKHNKYWVCFCYEDHTTQKNINDTSYLQARRKEGKEYLNRHTVSMDRGVARPVQSSADDTFFDFSKGEKKINAGWRSKSDAFKRNFHDRKKAVTGVIKQRFVYQLATPT